MLIEAVHGCPVYVQAMAVQSLHDLWRCFHSVLLHAEPLATHFQGWFAVRPCYCLRPHWCCDEGWCCASVACGFRSLQSAATR